MDVRAMAAGRAVRADELRAWRNRLILDDGDGTMTLCGSNEAKVVATGANVAAGEAIAQASASGGVEMPGVYFEVIPDDGQAVDSAPWSARDVPRAKRGMQ